MSADEGVSFPSWSYSDGPHNGGRDFLGLQSVGDAMLDRLLPGLTNQTRHPRYYAFFCWVFDRAARAEITSKQFHEFLFRFESALVLAGASHHGSDGKGIIGITKATKGPFRWQTKQDDYSLDKKTWSYRPSALDAAAYGPSFERLQLTRRKGPGSLELTPRGLRLATVFQKGLEERKFVEGLDTFSSKEVRGAALWKAHDDLCICRVRPGERAELREVLFRLSDASPVDEVRSRRLTLALVLDFVQQGNGEFSRDDDDLRTLLYFWRYPGKAKFKPTSQLESTAQAWRLFQARQYQRYAVETLWASYLRILSERDTLPFSPEILAVEIAERIKSAGLLEPSGVNAREVNRLSIGALADKLLPNKNSWSARSPSSEAAWKERIDVSLGEGASIDAFGCAVAMILVLWRRWAGTDEPDSARGFMAAGGRPRISLASMFAECERQKASSLRDFCSWLLTEYVVGQHLRVSADKLRREAINTFWFYAEEGGYRVQHDREVHRAKPGYNAPKLKAALSSLIDLGLIKRNEAGQYSCTRDGEKTLEAVLSKGV